MTDSPEEIDPLSDPEERRVLFAALDSFRQYRHAAHYNITHLRRQSFYSLPSAHMELLSSWPFSLPDHFRAVDDAIDSNADIADEILALGLNTYGVDSDSSEWKGTATPNDMDKARSTIRQLYRDWSEGGSRERQACYDYMIALLHECFARTPPKQRCHLKVLIPGAGLGRLAMEICKAGYSVDGNEISYHQLLASNWALNYARRAGGWTLYPWALSFSNHRTRANQLQSFAIPDVVAAEELEAGSRVLESEVHAFERMSMSSGDFCVLYKGPSCEGMYNAVVTCFFIDTAPNLIKYIETVKHCLSVGGVWINTGPLLWHFEAQSKPEVKDDPAHEPTVSQSQDQGIGDAGSFELTDDEVRMLVNKYGFAIRRSTWLPGVGYIQDVQSMLQSTYVPSVWVATKL